VLKTVDEAPSELAAAIREFWPQEEWDAAASVSFLESGWRWDAENDTTSTDHPCGSAIGQRGNISISAEHSIGFFQINACNYPDWNPCHFFNTRQNAGTAHALWGERGWTPWYFSAKALGLL